ncbi:MAG: amidase [Rhizobiales bacterium]|nr:amidase [Hyphomicrobiales bacterium]
MTATRAVALLARREICATDLVEAAIARIEAVDPVINALPIRCFERARQRAGEVDRLKPDDEASLLRGLPVAVKDYNDLAGVRTTYGSPIFADNVAEVSDATVARLEANGANPIAKSNVPEWAGGNTFNPVFGATRNPWNTAMSAGGSSGGSAAALASGMVWLATGNDLGGSLRTPAGFNSIVGLRPGPGLVPRGRRLQAFDTLWVEGPMGRCVEDVALMLDAGRGHDPADPFSFDAGPVNYRDQVLRDDAPARVAFSPDLGVVPMARDIAEICTTAAGRCADLGVDVTDDVPDFTGALDGFQTLRAVLLGTMMSPLLAEHRGAISPDIIGNIERGLAVTPQEVFAAERGRWQLYHRMIDFFETHDFLICPAASIAPFPVEQRYVEEIDGVPCKTYIDWFAITFALTMTSCPVISLPCGFTAQGLPVGLQIVGRPRDEASLLSFARQLEAVLGVAGKLPVEPQGQRLA